MTSARRAGRPAVWTEEQLEQAAALHARGGTILGIAAELGLSYATTRRLLVRAGRLRAVSPHVENTHRDLLLRLARQLERGHPLQVAANAEGVTLDAARLLIRRGAMLLAGPPAPAIVRQAEAVRAVLDGTDVQGAARDLGLDPWWALLVLLLTGSDPVSMQLQMHPDTRALAEVMAERRAAGATYDQIGREFGMTRERARQILITSGRWTPRSRAPSL
jgi:DNA-binding transcriptional regulator LsrR (DeoR family)